MQDLPDLSQDDLICLDLETKDPDLKSRGPGVRRDGQILGIAIKSNSFHGYLPFGHPEGPQYSKRRVIDWAKKELTRPNQPKLGANILYDLDYLYQEGVQVAGPFFDTQVTEPLIDENQFAFGLDPLAKKYFGRQKDDSELIAFGKTMKIRKEGVKGNLWRFPSNIVAGYAETDVELTWMIHHAQMPLIQSTDGLSTVFELECKLIPILLGMRRRGVRVDVEKARKVRDRMRLEITQLQKDLDSSAGERVDIWAAESLARLFDRNGIEYPRTPKTKAPSFVKGFLEKVENPIGKAIVKLRGLDKFVGTFLEGSILDMAVNGRVHTLFHQSKTDENGTVTGRFSSSAPNLQFIPARDEELGPLVRSIFVPEEGELWGRGDYSQIELRVLAHYGIGDGADEIRDNYQKNPDVDFHQMCADMTGISRTHAKRINFGLVYGMGRDKLSRELDLGEKDTQELLDKYFGMLPFVKHTTRVATQRAESRGWIRTLSGRRRRFEAWEPRDWDLKEWIKQNKNPQIVQAQVDRAIQEARKQGKTGRDIPTQGITRAGCYKALNALVQGSAADVMKFAMVAIEESGVREVLGPSLLTVHDELDESVPNTKIGKEAFLEMIRIMETATVIKVPTRVDYKLGNNWGECK